MSEANTTLQKLRNTHNVKIVVIAAATGMREEVISRKIKAGGPLSVNGLVEWFGGLLLQAVEKDEKFSERSYSILKQYGAKALREEIAVSSAWRRR